MFLIILTNLIFLMNKKKANSPMLLVTPNFTFFILIIGVNFIIIRERLNLHWQRCILKEHKVFRTGKTTLWTNKKKSRISTALICFCLFFPLIWLVALFPKCPFKRVRLLVKSLIIWREKIRSWVLRWKEIFKNN